MNILEDYYNPSVLHHEHSYSASGIYHQIQPTYDLNVSLPGWCPEHPLVLGGRRRGPSPPAAPFHGLPHPTEIATVRKVDTQSLPLELRLCGER